MAGGAQDVRRLRHRRAATRTTWSGAARSQLAELGVCSTRTTAIMISSDHGETLGELNVYGDHQAADEVTAHVPMILRWPGLAAARRTRRCTTSSTSRPRMVELLGGTVPDALARRRASPTRCAPGATRAASELVLSQGAWTCQRARALRATGSASRTYHDGYHGYPTDAMLFDVDARPARAARPGARTPAVVERPASACAPGTN